MSLKELLTSMSAENIEKLVKLLKQRETLAKQLGELDAKIESLIPTPRAANAGGKRRKPSIEIPELLAKTPAGLTVKEIMAALALKYQQAYVTLEKLKKANQVGFDEHSNKFSLKPAGKGKKESRG